MHNDSKHIPLNHFRICTTICFTIFHHFAHSRTKLIGPPNLAKKFTDNRVFRKWGKGVWVEYSQTMRLIAVFGAYLTVFNDKLSRKSVTVFSMDKNIGSNFPKNSFTNADSLYPFKVKSVREVLAYKGHDAIMTLNQIGINKIPIVITVKVNLAQDQVGTMMWHCRKDYAVLTQEKNTGKSNAPFTGFMVRLIKLGAFNQFHIIHVNPWMIFVPNAREPSASVNQIRTQVG